MSVLCIISVCLYVMAWSCELRKKHNHWSSQQYRNVTTELSWSIILYKCIGSSTVLLYHCSSVLTLFYYSLPNINLNNFRL